MAKDKDGIEIFSKDPATRLKQAWAEAGRLTFSITGLSILIPLILLLLGVI